MQFLAVFVCNYTQVCNYTWNVTFSSEDIPDFSSLLLLKELRLSSESATEITLELLLSVIKLTLYKQKAKKSKSSSDWHPLTTESSKLHYLAIAGGQETISVFLSNKRFHHTLQEFWSLIIPESGAHFSLRNLIANSKWASAVKKRARPVESIQSYSRSAQRLDSCCRVTSQTVNWSTDELIKQQLMPTAFKMWI